MSVSRLTPQLFASTRRLAAVSSQLSASASTSSSLGNSRRTMASVPKTMKAVIIEKNGGSDVLQYKTDFPVPDVKDGQLLVKNDFIGINYIDT